MTTALPTHRNGRQPALSGPGLRRWLARAAGSRRVQGAGMLLLLLAMPVSMLSYLFPREVNAANASAVEFSAERAMAHLPVIAKAPHPAGSPAQAAVREYLVQTLSGLGLETQVQPAGEFHNVVARLGGSAPTGAIVVLAHYDSQAPGPGAADNGADVAALLEVMWAVAAGPAPRNDVIALFDDAEEAPYVFLGTQLFVREHAWMETVRIALSLDTAVAGPVSVVETGEPNGFVVKALARVYRAGWGWTSLSGGGEYDTYAFRLRGIQALALGDNFAFRQQHTAEDTVDIVKPASVQQLGEQALAITRELGNLDLTYPWGEHETFFPAPLLGLVHYPQAWSLPLAAVGAILEMAALGMALRQRAATGLGLGNGLLAGVVTVGAAAFLTTLIWPRVPRWMAWPVGRWPEWPEVIPPNGWLVFLAFVLLGLGLALGAYALSRRVARPADLALGGLAWWAVIAALLAWREPRAAYLPTWPVIIGALGWLLALSSTRRFAAPVEATTWAAVGPVVAGAVALLAYHPLIIVSAYMSSSFNSLAVLVAAWRR